jgi:hypothetical protein
MVNNASYLKLHSLLFFGFIITSNLGWGDHIAIEAARAGGKVALWGLKHGVKILKHGAKIVGSVFTSRHHPLHPHSMAFNAYPSASPYGSPMYRPSTFNPIQAYADYRLAKSVVKFIAKPNPTPSPIYASPSRPNSETALSPVYQQNSNSQIPYANYAQSNNTNPSIPYASYAPPNNQNSSIPMASYASSNNSSNPYQQPSPSMNPPAAYQNSG